MYIGAASLSIPSVPNLGCSADRIMYDREADHHSGLLEMKCPDADFVSDCLYLTPTVMGSMLKKVVFQGGFISPIATTIATTLCN